MYTKMRLNFHQCRHTQRITGVFGEHQEGRAVRQQTAVQRHTVHDRAHAEFAHTVRQVVTAEILRFTVPALMCLLILLKVLLEGVKSAEPPRNSGSMVQTHPVHFWKPRGLPVIQLSHQSPQSTFADSSSPVSRQFARHTAFEFSRFSQGKRLRKRQTCRSTLLQPQHLWLLHPNLRKRWQEFQMAGCVQPKCSTGSCDFCITQGCTVAVV